MHLFNVESEHCICYPGNMERKLSRRKYQVLNIDPSRKHNPMSYLQTRHFPPCNHQLHCQIVNIVIYHLSMVVFVTSTSPLGLIWKQAKLYELYILTCLCALLDSQSLLPFPLSFLGGVTLQFVALGLLLVYSMCPNYLKWYFFNLLMGFLLCAHS